MKAFRKIAPGLCAVLMVGTQLAAQPADPAAVEDTTAVSTTSTQRLSPAEMKEQADALEKQVRLDLQHMQYLRAKARSQNDIIKLNCVNDRYVYIKAQANLFDEAHVALLAILDTDGRFDTFGRMSGSAAKVREARESAQACVGESELQAGSTSDVTSPEIVDDPTLGLPFDVDVEAPAYASPYI